MTSERQESVSLRRAVFFMTASSITVPLAGLATQPVLAHGLGVQGRGELAAAIAPSVLALAVATLGLPEAMTYFLAKRPEATRSVVARGAVFVLILGILFFIGTVGALPFLSGEDPRLANYITLAMAITVPALTVGLLRGAATGRQMWGTIALERFLTSGLRVIALVLLLATGHLTVMNAVATSAIIPMIGGLAYWRLLARPQPSQSDLQADDFRFKLVVSYGLRIWFGSVASMLLARTDQILMVPLSSVENLGIYSVATTVADLPLLVITALVGALTGVNSRTANRQQVADTTRITVLMGLLSCAALIAIVPIMITPLFGTEFAPAVVPTQLLVIASFLYSPGLVASVGLSSHGRPGLRSVSFGLAFAINVVVFITLVPEYGVYGGCISALVTAACFSTLSVLATARTIRVPVGSFVLIRKQDLLLLGNETNKLIERAKPRHSKKGR